MKASVAVLAALAASVSANANAHSASSTEELDVRGDQEPEVVRTLPLRPIGPDQADAHSGHGHGRGQHMPCHGSGSKAGSPSGSLGSLLSRLGFSGRPAFSMDMDHPSAVRSSVIKHWKDHVDSMISHHHLDSYQSPSGEDEDGAKLLPFLEGGNIRLMPLLSDDAHHDHEHKHWMSGSGGNGDRTPEIKWWRAIGRGRWLVKDNAGEWREPRPDEMPPRRGGGRGEHHHHAHQGGMMMTKEGDEVHGHRHGHHGQHGHRYRMAKSVAGRLHRALKNLKPAESIALAFVIGAGLGSILHFIFMLFLISIRSFRCGRRSRIALRDGDGNGYEGMTWEEARRARKMARKEARKARKAERKVRRAQNQPEGELLPAYEEGEQVRLVVEKE
ncbi:hypothetical protein IAT40_001284 [Kwoniella sp. CBS 6097]